MVLEPVLCPTCESSDVVKHGQSGEDKQRYKCRNPECGRSTFIREYAKESRNNKLDNYEAT
ncbi:MAG: hypothetical protein DCF22_06515 [Leptolyngbya sp.]|nr:MAG: hypothetical protein DCF22_06515 [Leptolyngbya sp.]